MRSDPSIRQNEPWRRQFYIEDTIVMERRLRLRIFIFDVLGTKLMADV